MTFAANSCFVVLRQAACVGGIFLFRQSIVSRFINIASNFPEHEEKSNWPEVPFFFPGFWIAFSVPRICTTVPFPVGKVSFYISSIMLCTPFGMLLNNSITPCALVVLQEVNSLTYFSLGKWLFCSCWLNLPNFDSFFAELFLACMIFDYSFSFAVKSSVFFSTRRGDFGCSRCICLIAWTFWWNHFWFFLFPVNDSLFLFLSILLLGDVYLRVLRFFIFGAVFSCPGH